MKKPLAPLIPLDQLKQVVAGLLTVPKDAIDTKPPKRPSSPKRQTRKTAQHNG